MCSDLLDLETRVQPQGEKGTVMSVPCLSILGDRVPSAWGHTVDTQHVFDE